MRRAVLSASAALAGAVALLVMSAASGAGAGAAQPASGAVVVLQAACFLLDGNGAVVSGPRSGGAVEFTADDDGAVLARCSARLAPAADGAEREWTHENTGLACTVQLDGRLVQTRDWRERVD